MSRQGDRSIRQAFGVLAMCAALPTCAADEHVELNLQRRATYELPSNASVMATAISADDRVALLLDVGIYLIAGNDATLVPPAIGMQPIGVGWSETGRMLVLDRRSIQWVYQGGRFISRPYYVPSSALQALHTPKGWFVLTMDSLGTEYGIHFGQGSDARRLHTLHTDASSIRADGRYALMAGSARDKAFVVQRERPHTVMELDSIGVTSEGAVAAGQPDAEHLWILVSAVQVGGRRLHTLSDLLSDNRKIITTIDGSTAAEVNLEYPLSLIGARPEDGTVYGLLSLNSVQMIEYSSTN